MEQTQDPSESKPNTNGSNSVKEEELSGKGMELSSSDVVDRQGLEPRTDRL